MDTQTQKNRFLIHWEVHSGRFGMQKWNDRPDFLFFVEIPISPNLISEMEMITEQLRKIAPMNDGLWVNPKKMHITIALPGRQGLHFQGNDRAVMERKLEAIISKYNSFEVTLGNINCFANGLFREVYDPSNNLYALHRDVSSAIPFSQDPQYQFDNFLPHMALYYGSGNAKMFQHPEFKRIFSETPMIVEKIFFGQIKSPKDEFEKQILKEFTLKTVPHHGSI